MTSFFLQVNQQKRTGMVSTDNTTYSEQIYKLFSRNHTTLCFWLRREARPMPNAEQLLYQTKKSSHWRFSLIILFLNFAIFTGKHLCEIIKNNYFEEHLRTAASEPTLLSDSLFGTLFLDHI